MVSETGGIRERQAELVSEVDTTADENKREAWVNEMDTVGDSNRLEEQMSLPVRYERKFLVDQLDAPAVIGLLKRHPAMFSEIYPPRQINNIYLDSPGMGSYFDNVDGVAERRKVRIRWYHDLLREVGDALLEVKVNAAGSGSKRSTRSRLSALTRDLMSAIFGRSSGERTCPQG